MALVIKTKSDNRQVHSLIQNLADIPGGVTVSTADLVPGSVIYEGAVLGFDEAGMAHVIKSAAVYEEAAANATAIKVKKGSQFKTGDIVTDGTASVAVAAVDRDSSPLFDTLTITLNSSTGLKKLVAGTAIEQGKAAGTSAAATKYEPAGMMVESYDVVANDNIFAPVVVIGTFKKSLVPPVSDAVLAKLKGIVLL